MKSKSFYRFGLFIGIAAFTLTAYSQRYSSVPSQILPALKDGSPAAFVQFTRPKITHGLILNDPDNVRSTSQIFLGYEGAMPAEDSSEKALYFQAATDQLVSTTGTFYVTIRYFDKGQGSVEIEYHSEKTSGDKPARTKRLFLGNSNIWQSHTFQLENAVLDHALVGENDFRILCPNVAIHSVALTRMPGSSTQQLTSPRFSQPSVNPPTGYEFAVLLKKSDDEMLWQSTDRLVEKIQLFRSWGARTVIDTIPIRLHPEKKTLFDFTFCTQREEKLAALGESWVPRIVIGVLDQLPSEVTVKLQRAIGTGRKGEGPMISLWEPKLPELYATIFSDLRLYFPPARLAKMVISVAGDWGPLCLSGDHAGTGWPDLWAGDPHALKSFQNFLEQRYGNLPNLNRAWKTALERWDEAAPSLSNSVAPLRAVDTWTWYHRSLTELTAKIIQTAKSSFSKTGIILEISDNFRYGATDIHDLVELAAQHSCTISLVTQNSLPTAASGWQWLSALCRRSRVPFGVRLTSAASAENILGTLYSLVSEGGRYWFFNEDDLAPEQAWKRLYETAPTLRTTLPQRAVAVVLPRTSVYVDGMEKFESFVHDCRDLFAFDVIDETDLGRITSTQYPMIFIPFGKYWSPQAFEAFDNLVRTGSTVIFRTDEPLETLQGDVGWNEKLFPVRLERNGDRWSMVPYRKDAVTYSEKDLFTAANQRTVQMGAGGDSAYISGDWGVPQTEATARRFGFPFGSFRWLGEQGRILLPVMPGKDYQLQIEGFIPKGKQVRVAINGRPFGTIQGTGTLNWQTPLTGQWKPQKKDVIVTLRAQTWNAGEVLGATETRALGMAVSRVSLSPIGQTLKETNENESPEIPNFQQGLLRNSWIRKVGNGSTILVPAHSMNDWTYMELLNYLVVYPKVLYPKYSMNQPPDGAANQVYVSPLMGIAAYLNLTNNEAALQNPQKNRARILLPPNSIRYVNY